MVFVNVLIEIYDHKTAVPAQKDNKMADILAECRFRAHPDYGCISLSQEEQGLSCWNCPSAVAEILH